MRLLELFDMMGEAPPQLSQWRNILHQYDSYQQIARDLKANGWKDISGGGGAYSLVYGKRGEDVVVKFLKGADPAECGLTWLKFAHDNWQKNPHIPRVYDIESYQGREGTMYVAVMELLKEVPRAYGDKRTRMEIRLNKGDEAELSNMASAMMSGFASHIPREEGIKFVYLVLKAHPELAEEVNQWMNRSLEGTHEHLMYQGGDYAEWARERAEDDQTSFIVQYVLRAYYPISGEHDDQYAELVRWLRDGGLGDCGLDMHSGNVMIRPSTGELVVTDPVFG